MSQVPQESLVKGIEYIDTLTAELDVTDAVTTKATELYRKTMSNATEENNIAHHGVKRIASASVLLGSRIVSDPTTAKQVAGAAPDTDEHITGKGIIRTSKEIREVLDIGAVLTDPVDVTRKGLAELDAPQEFRDKVIELVEAVKTDQVAVGIKAQTIAGASIYAVSLAVDKYGKQGYYTQTEIKHAVGVSEVSIRNKYREIGRRGVEMGILSGSVIE